MQSPRNCQHVCVGNVCDHQKKMKAPEHKEKSNCGDCDNDVKQSSIQPQCSSVISSESQKGIFF